MVIVIDGVPEDTAESAYRILDVSWLEIDDTDFLRLATAYPADELAESLKPLLLTRLLAEHEVAIYLDPHGQVFAPLHALAETAATDDIALIPRLLEPLPRDGRDPDDAALRQAGPFNLGLVAVSRNAKPLLDFWAEHARTTSLVGPRLPGSRGRHWIDLVPTLFRHKIVRDSGLSVGYWNAHERPLAQRPDGTITAAGEPLKFFQFTGYRPDTPWLLSAESGARPRVLLSENPRLRRLCDSYRERLLGAGYREDSAEGCYGFGSLADGTVLTPPMRELFRAEWLESLLPDADQVLFARAVIEPPPHPFGADAGAALRTWIRSSRSPLERAAGLNRLTSWVWHSRVDLQVAFPEPAGTDAPAFRQWCRAHGVAEGLLPDWALPAEPEPAQPPADVLGVNVVGYLTAELGIGQMGRILLRVAEHTGLPVVSVTDEYTVSCRTALDQPGSAGHPIYPISILTVNADYMRPLLAGYPEVGHDRYRIGLWAWELEDFPESLHHGFQFVEEVWTVSDFVREAIAKHSPVPVKTFPVPVLDPGPPARAARRPGAKVTFFFTFDFNSTGQRKNPWGLVAAFQSAFGTRDDVRLVIKTTNSALHSAAAERLRHTIGDDARIELVDRYATVAELEALYADCDAYVSLHRSEGFGLTVAEAMVRGLPVIATDYSSTTEFFDETVGWPVPYELIEVGPGWLPYQADGHWADPDLNAAARAMREVADNPAEAARRGAAARERILRTRSMDAAASWVRTQLEGAYRMWQEKRHRDSGTPTPMEPLNRAGEALNWRADAEAPSRVPLAPAMRRAMLRAIDHYDVHQRRVLAALLDGMRDSVELLEREVQQNSAGARAGMTELAARMDRIERALDALREPRRDAAPE